MADFSGELYGLPTSPFYEGDVVIEAQLVGLAGIAPSGKRYEKRARDAGGPPASYVTWETDDPAGAYPDPPPFGGPLVEETVVEVWLPA